MEQEVVLQNKQLLQQEMKIKLFKINLQQQLLLNNPLQLMHHLHLQNKHKLLLQLMYQLLLQQLQQHQEVEIVIFLFQHLLLKTEEFN